MIKSQSLVKRVGSLLLLLVFLSMPLVLATSVQAEEGLTPADEGVFVMAISYMPDALSPNTGGSDDYASMVSPIHDRLFYPTNDGYIARLAKEVEISKDATTYTVHLDPEANWSDGTPITSEDILFTIAYRKYRGKGVSAYESINNDPVEITAIDEKTLEFVLPYPYVAYFSYLGGITPYPAHVFDNDPEKVDDMLSSYYNSTEMVTSGPFTVAAINPDSIVLEAKEDYYLGTPQVKTIVLRTVGSGSTRNIAMENGEISYMRIINGEDLEKYADDDKYNIFSVSEDRTNYLQINPYGPQAELLANPKARKAIMHAINLEELIDIAYGDEALAQAATSLVNSNLYFFDPELDNYTYDLEKAKLLAEESGLAGETLVYIFNKDRVNMEQIAIILQQQLQQIGVNLEVESLDSSTFFPRFFSKGYSDNGQEKTWDLGTNGWDSERGMAGGHTFSYFTAKNRDWGYSEELSDLAIKAYSATTPEEGREIYKKVQAMAKEEAWGYPLTNPNFVIIAQKNISGLDQTLVPEFTDWLAIEVH